MLESRGGTHLSLSSTSLGQLTHIIADSAEFPAYEDACSAFINVVRPAWVEHSVNKERLANTRTYRPDPRLFLSGVVVTISDDIPQGDKDAIIGGVLAMGGQYSPIMTTLVTHVVALNMDNKKCRIMVQNALKCKAVLPHWFDQCLLLGKMIDPSPYVLPDPSILRSENIDEELKDKSKYSDNMAQLKDVMQLHTPPNPIVSPSKSRKELSVFRNRRIKLGDDLQLEPHFRDTIVSLITKGAGQLCDKIDQADTLVCRHRSGLDFLEALDLGKDIGNITWLCHLISKNKWSSPLRRMLHFPIPKKPLPGFDKYVISVSNYTGEARTYLESLIAACGGKFTKTMTQNNTHLITAHTRSEKVTAAQEWDIATVNHLWLEESYAACRGLALTNPRFTAFPLRTNLGEIIGQTQLDRQTLENTHLRHRKGSEDVDPAKTPGRPVSKGAITPGIHADRDKENSTPGSRSAKDRAINKLHLMAPDIAQFQKELKRPGGVIYGGRRIGDADRVAMQPKTDAPTAQKRPSNDGADKQQGDSPAAKRKKTTPQPAPTEPLRFVVTGGQGFKWTEAKGRALSKYGMQELSKLPANGTVDVLVAPRVMRTPNFLAGVAAGVAIVGPSWLDEVAAQGRCVDTQGHELKHVPSENEFKVTLSIALSRARQHREKGGRMLTGMTIYCTENIKGGVGTIADIVKHNGGTCLTYKGLDVNVGKHHEGPAYLVTLPRDRAVWEKFVTAAHKKGREARVVSSDWLLRIALTQKKDEWDEAWAYKLKSRDG